MDFTAVGVGPLTFNPEYVEKGEPADCLKGDPRFMAKRMRLKYPIFPPSTRQELGMIKRFCAKCPQPKMKDIQDLCRQYKAKSNGIDVFPKVPSIIKSYIKRFIINEQRALLEQQIKASFDEIYEKFRSDKVTLEMPEQPMQNITETERPLATAAPKKLQRPYVAPLSAPAGKQFVPPAVGLQHDRKCKWWPMCKKKSCGGAMDQGLCSTFGKNGTSTPPTQSELRYKTREESWSEQAKRRNCPWGCGKAILCGGITKNNCEKYGDKGTCRRKRPSEEEIKKRRTALKTQQQRERRAQLK